MNTCSICLKRVEDLDYHIESRHSYLEIKEMLVALMANLDRLDWKQTKLVYKNEMFT